jgi:hypothetical protein
MGFFLSHHKVRGRNNIRGINHSLQPHILLTGDLIIALPEGVVIQRLVLASLHGARLLHSRFFLQTSGCTAVANRALQQGLDQRL